MDGDCDFRTGEANTVGQEIYYHIVAQRLLIRATQSDVKAVLKLLHIRAEAQKLDYKPNGRYVKVDEVVYRRDDVYELFCSICSTFNQGR